VRVSDGSHQIVTMLTFIIFYYVDCSVLSIMRNKSSNTHTNTHRVSKGLLIRGFAGSIYADFLWFQLFVLVCKFYLVPLE
jgi:ABC-type uncharacterized transport system permease subunit